MTVTLNMRLGVCGACENSRAKYTCPKCKFASCSLKCVQQHKQESGCDGIRNKTNYNYLNHRGVNTSSEALHFRQGKHFIFRSFTDINSKVLFDSTFIQYECWNDVSIYSKRIHSAIR